LRTAAILRLVWARFIQRAGAGNLLCSAGCASLSANTSRLPERSPSGRTAHRLRKTYKGWRRIADLLSTGHVRNFDELLLARALMGGSEARYIPAALASARLMAHPGGGQSHSDRTRPAPPVGRSGDMGRHRGNLDPQRAERAVGRKRHRPFGGGQLRITTRAMRSQAKVTRREHSLEPVLFRGAGCTLKEGKKEGRPQ
jgi:hypothetical protein